MSKPSPARYRTMNWSSSTAALRQRGSLLIWLDKGMTWLAPHDGSPGRPALFSDAAIQFCLTIKVLLCKEDCPAAIARNETLRATRHYGRAFWKRWTGYHVRSRIEANPLMV
jgi:hypothetical protein